MKENKNENYELEVVLEQRKYAAALEIAREYHNECKTASRKTLEAIFPELRESEDERIRKSIVSIINQYARMCEKEGDPCEASLVDDALAYLEKQKEQSITANDLDEEIHRFFDDCIDVHEAKLYGSISERVIPVDCYELTARHFAKWGEKQKEQKPIPIFKIGDKIKLKSEPKYPYREIVDIKDGAYYFDRLVHLPFEHQEDWEKEPKPVEWSENFDEEVEKIHKRYPEVSFAKLTRIAYHFSKWANRRKDIEWSGEDDAAHTRILGAVAKAFMGVLPTKPSEEDVSWLKSLPERFNLQPKMEWSEGEMEVLDSIIDDYKKANKSFCGYAGKIVLLNAIRNGKYNLPKQEWSEEDKRMIEEVDETLFMSESGVHEAVKKMIEGERQWLNELPSRFKSLPRVAISEEALREGIGHYGITQHQIDNWLKKYITIV